MEEGRERPERVAVSEPQPARVVEAAFVGGQLASWHVLAAGLANTNLCFRLEGSSARYVLRIYTRDPAAAQPLPCPGAVALASRAR